MVSSIPPEKPSVEDKTLVPTEKDLSEILGEQQQKAVETAGTLSDEEEQPECMMDPNLAPVYSYKEAIEVFKKQIEKVEESTIESPKRKKKDKKMTVQKKIEQYLPDFNPEKELIDE